MKKSGIFTASYVGVAAVWLGGHFGPGFATGGFSTQWYVRYGVAGIFLPLLAMLVTGGIMYYMMEYARRNHVNNYKPFAISCYGPKFGPVMSVLYDITFLLTVMCAGGLAISGEGNILMQHLHVSYWVGAIGTIVVAALLSLYGSKLLSRASAYMMYFILGVVLLITILAFAYGDYDLSGSIANSATNAKDPNLFSAIWHAILYGCFQSSICFNVLSVSDVLEDAKASKKAAALGYLVTVALMIALIVILFSYTNVYDICAERLPIYSVLTRLGFSWLRWLYVILMTLAVLSSAAGLAYAGTVRFDGLLKNVIKDSKIRKTAIVVVLLGLAALGASFGLLPLMRTGTSVVGYFSIPVIVIPAFTWVRSRLSK